MDERLRDEVEGIYAVKDDVCGEFVRRLSLLVYDRWALIASGNKRHVLNVIPYGCDGYMSGFICFKPELAHEFCIASLISIDVEDPGMFELDVFKCPVLVGRPIIELSLDDTST